MADAMAEGRLGRGKARLDAAKVTKIVALRRKYGLAYWMLAETFDVSTTSIRFIFTGKSWSAVTGIQANPSCKGGRPNRASCSSGRVAA
jgi:hypothetical protein